MLWQNRGYRKELMQSLTLTYKVDLIPIRWNTLILANGSITVEATKKEYNQNQQQGKDNILWRNQTMKFQTINLNSK